MYFASPQQYAVGSREAPNKVKPVKPGQFSQKQFTAKRSPNHQFFWIVSVASAISVPLVPGQ